MKKQTEEISREIYITNHDMEAADGIACRIARIEALSRLAKSIAWSYGDLSDEFLNPLLGIVVDELQNVSGDADTFLAGLSARFAGAKGGEA